MTREDLYQIILLVEEKTSSSSEKLQSYQVFTILCNKFKMLHNYKACHDEVTDLSIEEMKWLKNLLMKTKLSTPIHVRAVGNMVAQLHREIKEMVV